MCLARGAGVPAPRKPVPATKGGRAIAAYPAHAADAAGASGQGSGGEYRLPRTVRPVRYELSLSIDPDAPRFGGSERAELVISERVAEIVCNCAELVITSASIRPGQQGEAVAAGAAGAAGSAPLPCRVRLDPDAERAVFTPPAPLPPGRYVLDLDYSGELRDKLSGLYRSRFTGTDGTVRLIAATQFESADARRAFPCWDEPDFKAAFAVTLDVPDGLMAVSNGPEIAATPLPGGYRRVRFAQTPPMSSYLVAFVVGPLEASRTIDADGVPLRVIHVPGKGHLTQFALRAGAFALRFFQEWFGIAYPRAKLDLVAIPDRLGAMENLGAAIFVDSALLVDEANAPAADLARIAGVIAHEIAHMWFGDLVTMKWWNGIWLNEAFASFMHLTCVSHFQPDWEPWAGYARQRDDALTIDALRSARPIEFPVSRPDEAEAMFDVLTYQKGASVLRMIEQHAGAERFREGVRRYLRAHQFANTETTDLWAAIGEAVADPSIIPMMDSWVYQGGVPLVEVSRQDGDVLLSQRRFFLPGNGEPAAGHRADHGPGPEAGWLIPISLEYRNAGSHPGPARKDSPAGDQPGPAGDGSPAGDQAAPAGDGSPAGDQAAAARVRLVLGPQPVRLTGQGPHGRASLLIANAGGHGYYRTRYDPGSFGKLVASFARLQALEQLTLASDSWAFVLAGISGLEDFLSLLATLDETCEPAVWGVVHDCITLLDHAVPEADRPVLRRWCGSLLSPVLDRLGWLPAPDERPRLAAARSALIRDLGLVAGDAAVIERARASYQQSLAGRGTADPGTREAILAVVAGAGGRAEFEQFRAGYEHAASPQERRWNLHALIELRDPALVAEVLAMCLAGMRGEDVAYLLRSMLATRHGGTAGWHFLRDNWGALITSQPEKSIWRILSGVSWLIGVAGDGTAPVAEDARAFIAAHPLGGLQQLAEQSLELLDVRLAFVRRERARIRPVLSAF